MKKDKKMLLMDMLVLSSLAFLIGVLSTVFVVVYNVEFDYLCDEGDVYIKVYENTAPPLTFDKDFQQRSGDFFGGDTTERTRE